MLKFFKSNKKPSKEDVYKFLDVEKYNKELGQSNFTQKDLQNYCKKVGVDNVRFLAPLVKPMFKGLFETAKEIPKGVFHEKRESPISNNEYYVECGIDESQALRRVEDGYKMELYSIEASDVFSNSDYYVVDLASLIQEGHIKIIVGKK